MTGGTVVVCVKWVDLRPEIDPVHATLSAPAHSFGYSEPDRAAVEVALRIAEEREWSTVVLCAGSSDADDALRELLAAGVDRAIRIDADDTATSAGVAGRLAASIGSLDASLVVCGDLSADRGSGSVPAFLAHELGVAQALGLVRVDTSGDQALDVVRRLDGGRRERLRVEGPAVISVEGSVADLRRAPLSAMLASSSRPVDVIEPAGSAPADPVLLRPWRPRPRVLPAPVGDRALDRIVQLTGALVERTPPTTVELDAEGAAAAILEQLRTWGYLEPPEPTG